MCELSNEALISELSKGECFRYIRVQAAKRIAELEQRAEKAERELDEIEGLLGGPFSGTEGLDSFTLAWVIARIRELRGKEDGDG